MLSKLQNICKHENREPLGAQWFEDYVTSEKLQNSLQKAYFPGKEVIPDFQMSPPKLQKLKKNHPNERFYEIFFLMCQKYGVRWASAAEKERQFIEEVTRVTYERERALRLGFPLSDQDR